MSISIDVPQGRSSQVALGAFRLRHACPHGCDPPPDGNRLCAHLHSTATKPHDGHEA